MMASNDKEQAMKNYNTYVKEAQKLRSKLQQESDAAAINKKLSYMQMKVNQSQLTVYQKEFLLRQLASNN
jgi:hypothetical protein